MRRVDPVDILSVPAPQKIGADGGCKGCAVTVGGIPGRLTVPGLAGVVALSLVDAF